MAYIHINPVVRTAEGGEGDWWSAAPLAGAVEDKPMAAPAQVQPNYGDAIAKVESGGNYRAVGPTTGNGDRALGKYQIMSKNVGPWSKEVLGEEITPTQFMASPDLQDKIFQAKFGSYVDKYGPEGASKAWFAGEKGMNNPNAKDVLGTSVSGYASKFMNALGPGTAQAAPSDIIPQGQKPKVTSAPIDDNSWWQNTPVAKAAQAPVTAPQPKGPQVGPGDAMARGVASGATFNFYDELRGLMEAGGLNPKDPASLSALLQGAVKYWGGDKEAGQKYDTAVTRERALAKAGEEQNPIASTVGNVAGAIALPVGGILNGATLGARAARGAGVGAVFGGLSGAGEGVTPEDRMGRAASGMAVGGAIGGVAAPVVEGVVQGGRAALQPLITGFRGATNPQGEAARRVATAIRRDMQADPNATSRLTAGEFGASAQNGGPATIMDLGGETTRSLARSAANTSPEGRNALNGAINDRFEGQSGRVTDWLRSAFNYPDAGAQSQAIQQVAKSVNKPAYAKAYQDGDRGLWSPELERLTSSPDIVAAMRDAAIKGKSRAVTDGFGGFNPGVKVENDILTFGKGPNGVPTYPNLQFWDYTKRALDDATNAAKRSGRNEEASVLTQLGQQLRGELDNLVPSYAAARSGAASFFKADNALEAGQNFVTARLANADARRALSKMTPQERKLFQDGFVSRYIETIAESGDRRSILNSIAQSPAARDRLNIALGPQRAAELEAGLRVEGIMDLARGAVQGNSTTARQLAELGFAGGAGSLGAYGAYNSDPQQMTYAAVAGALLAGKRGIDTRVARHVAEMLMSNDPQRLRQGIQLLARNGRFMDALRTADAKIASVSAAETPKTLIPTMQLPAPSRAQGDQPEIPRPPGQ